MESLPQRTVYDIGIMLITSIGENINYTSKKIWIFRLLNCVILVFLFVITFANFFHVGSEIYVTTVESLLVSFHPLLKYIVLIYYKPDLNEILKNAFNKFWKYQDFSDDIIFTSNKLYRRTKFAQIIMVIGAYAVVYLFLLRPYFNNKIVFPLQTGICGNSLTFDSIVLMLQHYVFYFEVAICFGYDIFYLSFCVDIVTQVRLLKYKLKLLLTTSSEDISKEICSCIKHHQFLLSMFKNMKRIFSILLLFHYFVSLGGTCTELYEFMLGKSSTSRTIQAFVNVCVTFFEFAFYTFPAEQVAFEFLDISNSMYMTKWYETNISSQKLCLVIMLRCQQEEYLTGGGVIDINIQTFGSVVRKTLSFYAVLRNILNK